jgi:Transcription initiation factor IID, 18kD subunit
VLRIYYIFIVINNCNAVQELRCMLYGYGDDRNPYTETVDFLEDLVFQFITDMTQKAMEIGRQNRVQVCTSSFSLIFTT